ncbi:MAG: hypothetical protein HXX20_24835, partial [Chloroflexi bacterium]|nr:hypothetical protein [Chloroflexota bacterium]
DERENQLAEQHPTNGGNLSRPDERENQLAEQHPTNRDHLSRPGVNQDHPEINFWNGPNSIGFNRF